MDLLYISRLLLGGYRTLFLCLLFFLVYRDVVSISESQLTLLGTNLVISKIEVLYLIAFGITLNAFATTMKRLKNGSFYNTIRSVSGKNIEMDFYYDLSGLRRAAKQASQPQDLAVSEVTSPDDGVSDKAYYEITDEAIRAIDSQLVKPMAKSYLITEGADRSSADTRLRFSFKAETGADGILKLNGFGVFSNRLKTGESILSARILPENHGNRVKKSWSVLRRSRVFTICLHEYPQPLNPNSFFLVYLLFTLKYSLTSLRWKSTSCLMAVERASATRNGTYKVDPYHLIAIGYSYDDLEK